MLTTNTLEPLRKKAHLYAEINLKVVATSRKAKPKTSTCEYLKFCEVLIKNLYAQRHQYHIKYKKGVLSVSLTQSQFNHIK